MIALDLVKNGVKYSPRPVAIPYNCRVSYRIAQLLLIITICASRGCSLAKINLISNSILNSEDRDSLLKYIKGLTDDIPIVRFDPTINQALLYAIGDQLIIQNRSGNYELTDKGRNFVSDIIVNPSIMMRERKILGEIGKKLSDRKLKTMMDKWRYENVES